MDQSVSVVITVNSPGEVSGWLKPFLMALKSASWKSSVSVFIPPCTFASGSECEVVRAMPEVDLVVEPGDVWRFLLFGKKPLGFRPTKSGVVVFLGGDLTWAAWIAKRLAFPAIAYTEGFASSVKAFFYFAQPYQSMIHKLVRQGVPEAKLRLVGNLMLDAVDPAFTKEEVHKKLHLETKPLLLLMPGSRPSHFEYMLPFFVEVAERCKEKLPELEIIVSISPYIDDLKVQTALKNPSAKLGGRTGTFLTGTEISHGISSLEEPGVIQTDSGVTIRVLRGRQYDLMSVADLAVSLPGTNTMELSFLGVPFIITIPLLYPERIPIEGIGGLIGNVPLAGKALKRWLIPRIAAKRRFTAWPNMLAQEEIIPELRGQITASGVSETVVDLIKKPESRAIIAKRLQKLVGEKGAANRLIYLVEEVLHNQPKDFKETY